MPKVQRETQKDITSMQQEVKRRNKASPGIPLDIGTWAGAKDTKYRWLVSSAPTFALGFIAQLSVTAAFSKLFFNLMFFSLLDSIKAYFNKELSENAILLDWISDMEIRHPANESLTCVDNINYQKW